MPNGKREEAIDRLKSEIKGPLVCVAFTESVLLSAGWTENTWRNGLELPGQDGPVAEFCKHNLVLKFVFTNWRVPIAPTQLLYRRIFLPPLIQRGPEPSVW
jgi:hypothetical protein